MGLGGPENTEQKCQGPRTHVYTSVLIQTQHMHPWDGDEGGRTLSIWRTGPLQGAQRLLEPPVLCGFPQPRCSDRSGLPGTLMAVCPGLGGGRKQEVRPFWGRALC